MFTALCRSAATILIAAGLLQLPGKNASADERLVGQRVLTIRPDVSIMRGNRAIFRCEVGEPLTVEGVHGEWLNVGIGFVARGDVLPMEEAMRRFTRQIETDPSAEHYYQRARGYLAKDDTTQALLDVSECLIKHRDHAQALVLRGECWHHTGRLQQALDSFNEAIVADKEYGIAYLERGKIHLRTDAYENAKADFDSALRLRRDLVSAHMGRALALFHMHRFAEASGDIAAYLLFVPEDADAYESRARCYVGLREFNKAAEDMTTCIRLEPKEADHYVRRGQILLAAEQFAKGAADLRAAIKLRPDVAETHFFLGAALIKCNEHDNALKELDKAVELDANLADAHSIRALFWFNKKDFAKALADLDAAIRINSEDDTSLGLRGWLLATAPDAAIRNGKQALQDAIKACELTHYAKVEPLKCLAVAQAEVGDFDEAVRWQKKAIELNKDDDDKEELAEALRFFEQKKPLRTE